MEKIQQFLETTRDGTTKVGHFPNNATSVPAKVSSH